MCRCYIHLMNAGGIYMKDLHSIWGRSKTSYHSGLAKVNSWIGVYVSCGIQEILNYNWCQYSRQLLKIGPLLLNIAFSTAKVEYSLEWRILFSILPIVHVQLLCQNHLPGTTAIFKIRNKCINTQSNLRLFIYERGADLLNNAHRVSLGYLWIGNVNWQRI